MIVKARTARNRGSRAMTSAVNWSLLGLVISRASYGLELARRFERTYGDVLPLSGDPHVYSALDALEKRGLIKRIRGAGADRQPKPRYRATPQGVQAYEDWLVEQVDTERRRQELWVRQLSVFGSAPEVALRVLARFEHQYLQTAGQVGSAHSGIEADGADGELIVRLVAEQQRLAVGGMLSWLQFAREHFEAVVARERGGDGAPGA